MRLNQTPSPLANSSHLDQKREVAKWEVIDKLNSLAADIQKQYMDRLNTDTQGNLSKDFF